MSEFLLELRTEGIPVAWVAEVTQTLKNDLVKVLRDRGLPPRRSATSFTARRIMVLLRDLPAQPTRALEEQPGPRIDVAFDADGNPSDRLIAFLERHGASFEELVRVKRPNGEFVVLRRHGAGASAPSILAAAIAEVVPRLPWPATMRWGNGGGPWARPLRGLLAVLDGEVVPVEIFGVQSTNTSVGHALLSARRFEVANASAYARRLSRGGVEIRFFERRNQLGAAIGAAAEGLGGTVVADDELLERLAVRSETPGIVVGEIAPDLLAMPREIVVACLRERQGSFAIQRDGNLLPHFIAVMDRPDDPEGRVRRGNEWAVAAHLQDVQFQFLQDQEVPLAERRRRLEAEQFHERLGSYDAKAERLAQLCAALSVELGWSQEEEFAVEAARLLKADMTCRLAREFPPLRGVIGGLLAKEEGYPETLWQALYDQYLPNTATPELPRSRVGRLVAVADRIDTLVGLAAIEELPGGIGDPLACRPLIRGLLRILIEAEMPLDLDLAAARALRGYGSPLASETEALPRLRAFVDLNLRALLEEDGYAPSEIDAVLGAGGSPHLHALRMRVDTLHNLRDDPRFAGVVQTSRRLLDILQESPEYSMDPKLLVEDAEKDLYVAYQKLKRDLDELLVVGDPKAWVDCAATLCSEVESFLGQVLIRDENDQLRRNRLALMQTVHRSLSKHMRLAELAL